MRLLPILLTGCIYKSKNSSGHTEAATIKYQLIKSGNYQDEGLYQWDDQRRWTCQFPIAAITDYHRLSGLIKTPQIYYLTVQLLESTKWVSLS